MLSHDWILHPGNFAGFQAVIAWLPGTSHGIALLCNRGDAKPPELAARILAALEPSLPPVDGPRYSLPPPAVTMPPTTFRSPMPWRRRAKT